MHKVWIAIGEDIDPEATESLSNENFVDCTVEEDDSRGIERITRSLYRSWRNGTLFDEMNRDLERTLAGVEFVFVSQSEDLLRAERLLADGVDVVVHFADPTKIPLEIVIAAAEGGQAQLTAVAVGLTEFQVVAAVLEKGPYGIVYIPTNNSDLREFAQMRTAEVERQTKLPLTSMVVDRIEHVGVGDRVCVDTAS